MPPPMSATGTFPCRAVVFDREGPGELVGIGGYRLAGPSSGLGLADRDDEALLFVFDGPAAVALEAFATPLPLFLATTFLLPFVLAWDLVRDGESGPLVFEMPAIIFSLLRSTHSAERSCPYTAEGVLERGSTCRK